MPNADMSETLNEILTHEPRLFSTEDCSYVTTKKLKPFFPYLILNNNDFSDHSAQ